jgi:hypothetical protein
MKGKIISYISNGALIIGAIIGIYVFADVYILKSRLPSGVCPVTSNKPLMYIAITFLGISLILSFFGTKNKKKGNN